MPGVAPQGLDGPRAGAFLTMPALRLLLAETLSQPGALAAVVDTLVAHLQQLPPGPAIPSHQARPAPRGRHLTDLQRRLRPPTPMDPASRLRTNRVCHGRAGHSPGSDGACQRGTCHGQAPRRADGRRLLPHLKALRRHRPERRRLFRPDHTAACATRDYTAACGARDDAVTARGRVIAWDHIAALDHAATAAARGHATVVDAGSTAAVTSRRHTTTAGRDHAAAVAARNNTTAATATSAINTIRSTAIAIRTAIDANTATSATSAGGTIATGISIGIAINSRAGGGCRAWAGGGAG